MSKRYELTDVRDLLQLDERQFADVLVDIRNFYSVMKPMHDAFVRNGLNTKEIVQPFTWIDDGEHAGSVRVKGEHNE